MFKKVLTLEKVHYSHYQSKTQIESYVPIHLARDLSQFLKTQTFSCKELQFIDEY